MSPKYALRSLLVLATSAICNAAFSQPFSLPEWAEKYFNSNEIQSIISTAEKLGRPNYVERTVTQVTSTENPQYEFEDKCTITSGGFEYCVNYSGWSSLDPESPTLFASESLAIGGLIVVLVIQQNSDGKTIVSKVTSLSAEIIDKELKSYSTKHSSGYEISNQCEKKGTIKSTTIGKLHAVQFECVNTKSTSYPAGHKTPIYYLPEKNIFLPGSYLEPELHRIMQNAKLKMQLSFK